VPAIVLEGVADLIHRPVAVPVVDHLATLARRPEVHGGVGLGCTLVVGGIVQDAQLESRKVILAAHHLGVKDGQVRALVAGDLGDVGQLLAFRVHRMIVGVGLPGRCLRAVAGAHPALEARTLRVLAAVVLVAQQLIPKVIAIGLGQVVSLVVVLDVELLQIVRGHPLLVVPPTVPVGHVHQHERRLRLGKGQLEGIVVDHVQLHELAAPAEVDRRQRRDLFVLQHVLIEEQEIRRGQRLPIRPLDALADVRRDGGKVLTLFPAL